MLVVVVFTFGHIKQRTNNEIAKEESSNIKKGKIKIPWYVIGFFITCALFTCNIISPEVSNLFKFISNKFEIIAIRLRMMPFKTQFTPDYKLEMNGAWGKKYPKAGYVERVKQEVQLFDIREFVKAKKKEKME